MKIINLLLAVMFLAFAFLQINDPDPVIWILIYGAMAVVCILAAFRYYSQPFIIAFTFSLAVYSFFFVPGVITWLANDNKSALFDDVAKMQYPYIEESREFLGLLICIIVLIVQFIRSRKAILPA